MARKKPEQTPPDDSAALSAESLLESELAEPDEPAVEAAPEAESPEQDSPEPQLSLREILQARGITVQGETDDEAIAGLNERLERSTRYEQVEHEREQLRQQNIQYQLHLQSLQPQIVEYQRLQAEQAKPKAPEAPPVDAFLDELLAGPKLPNDWQQWLDPETKQLRAETPPNVRQSVADFIEYRDNLPQRLAEALKGNLPNLIESRAAKLIDEKLGAQVKQIEAQQTAGLLMQQNVEWLYSKDESGRSQYNPLTGQGTLSPAGQRMGEILQELAQAGMSDVKTAWSIAHRQVYLESQAAKSATQGATTAGEDQRRAFEREQAGSRKPNRSGSVPKTSAAPVQNRFHKFNDMIANAFQEIGVGD